MNNLYDFGQAIIQIRNAADIVEVKGAKNAALISLIYEKCNEIITELNKFIQEKTESKQETKNQVGETDGQVDS